MDTAIKNHATTPVPQSWRRAPKQQHRTTIAVPQSLLEEALAFGHRDGLSSLNAVVQAALEEYTERRRRAAFAAAIAEMGRDPDIIRESDQINELFAIADADGLA